MRSVLSFVGVCSVRVGYEWRSSSTIVLNNPIPKSLDIFVNMSGLTLKSMTTAESEFFAEETMITISPNFSHSLLLFTSGSFGPLVAGDPCVVPLWLAITLRKRGKCVIVIPEWMSVTSLEQNILNEKKDEHFEPLQFHYKEISQLLLNYARDDVREPDRVSALLQDIENIRMDRAKMGMIGVYSLPQKVPHLR